MVLDLLAAALLLKRQDGAKSRYYCPNGLVIKTEVLDWSTDPFPPGPLMAKIAKHIVMPEGALSNLRVYTWNYDSKISFGNRDNRNTHFP